MLWLIIVSWRNKEQFTSHSSLPPPSGPPPTSPNLRTSKISVGRHKTHLTVISLQTLNLTAEQLRRDSCLARAGAAGKHCLPCPGIALWPLLPAWHFFKWVISSLMLITFNNLPWAQCSVRYSLNVDLSGRQQDCAKKPANYTVHANSRDLHSQGSILFSPRVDTKAWRLMYIKYIIKQPRLVEISGFSARGFLH